MLLPDGAHFSLLGPRLQSLRELIEEARALADRPSRRCGSAATRRACGPSSSRSASSPSRREAWQRQISGLLELDSIAEHELPADAERGAAALPARGLQLARNALESRARRDPRRRHGPRQDTAGARARFATPASATRGWARSSSSRRRASSRAGSAKRPASPPGCSVRGEPTRSRSRGGRSARLAEARHRRHDVHAAAARRRRLPVGALGGRDPRRGAVRQEPPGQDLHVRARARSAVQARDHRHADGEQPDGALVAALDHGARAVPRPEAVRRAVREADRAWRRHRAARAAATPDQAARQAAHEGARRRRPAAPSRSRPSRSTSIPATASSTTPTCSASGRRSSALLGDFDRNRFTILPLDHAACGS